MIERCPGSTTGAGPVRVALLQQLDRRHVAAAVGPAEDVVDAERLRVRPAEQFARPRLDEPGPERRRPCGSSRSGGSGRTCGRGSGRTSPSGRGTRCSSRRPCLRAGRTCTRSGRSARRSRCPGGGSRWRSTRRSVAVRQLVAGELLEDEPVVRHVVVERPDDPVAVLPDVRLHLVALVAARLGVARRRRASSGPSARRSAATRAAGRPASRRRPATLSFGERFDLLGRRRQAERGRSRRGG